MHKWFVDYARLYVSLLGVEFQRKLSYEKMRRLLILNEVENNEFSSFYVLLHYSKPMKFFFQRGEWEIIPNFFVVFYENFYSKDLKIIKNALVKIILPSLYRHKQQKYLKPIHNLLNSKRCSNYVGVFVN